MIPFRHGIATFLLISTVFALQDTVEVKRKDSKKAFIYSLIPGMGQAYNGKWIKSALVIGLEASAYVSWQENLKKYRDYNSNDYPLNRHRYLEKRNKFALDLFTKKYRKRVVKPKKGKGSFKRKKK